jgi:hypothetical protein
LINSGPAAFTSDLLKLKSSGMGCPLGNLIPSYLNSSKNLCPSASIGVNLCLGSYFKMPDISDTASVGAFDFENNFTMFVGLIDGNLNSE